LSGPQRLFAALFKFVFLFSSLFTVCFLILVFVPPRRLKRSLSIKCCYPVDKIHSPRVCAGVILFLFDPWIPPLFRDDLQVNSTPGLVCDKTSVFVLLRVSLGTLVSPPSAVIFFPPISTFVFFFKAVSVFEDSGRSYPPQVFSRCW